jgi:hypothetical protein
MMISACKYPANGVLDEAFVAKSQITDLANSNWHDTDNQSQDKLTQLFGN